MTQETVQVIKKMKTGVEVEEKRVSQVLKSSGTEVRWSEQQDISDREIAGGKFDKNFERSWEREGLEMAFGE